MRTLNEKIKQTPIFLKLKSSLQELLKVTSARKLPIGELIKSNIKFSNVEDLQKNILFKKDLEEQHLDMGDILDTRDSQTFCLDDVRILPIYSKRESDIASVPYAILVSRYVGDKLEGLEMYGIKSSWSAFIDSLNIQTFDLVSGNDKASYKTTDGGKSWIKLSGSETLPEEIEGEDLDKQEAKGREVILSYR